jgi:hypothetical protein
MRDRPPYRNCKPAIYSGRLHAALINTRERRCLGCFRPESIGRFASRSGLRFDGGMPRDPFIREKFTKERTAAKKLAVEYFQRFPKDRYQTEVESWRHLQSQNIEFTMKRLRDPIDADKRGGT